MSFPLSLDSPVLDVGVKLWTSVKERVAQGQGDQEISHALHHRSSRLKARVIKYCRAYPELIVATPESTRAWTTRRSLTDTLTRAADDAEVLRREQVNALSNLVGTSSGLHLGDTINTPIQLCDSTRRYDSFSQYWHEVIYLADKNRPKFFSSSSAVWQVGGDIWEHVPYGYICIKPNSECWFISQEQALMYKDIAASRFNVSLALDLGIGTLDASPYLRNAIEFQYDWQLRCVEKYGNNGYELAKAPESVFKTRLSELSGGNVSTPTPFDRMVTKYREKESKLTNDTNDHPLADEFAAFARSITELKTATELFGLMKSCGHPLIDPREAAKSASEYGKKPERVSTSAAIRVTCVVKHMITVGYLSKTGTWPSFDVAPRADTALGKLFRDRKTSFDLHDIDVLDYESVEFGKNQEIDWMENYADLVDDKAIAGSGLSSISRFWTHGVDASERRLLLDLLSKPGINIREISEMVCRRTVPPDHYIVCLYPKEREMKLAARLFGMLTLEMRSYFAFIEHQIANLLDMIPQVTMTMSRSEIDRRFSKLTSPTNAERFWRAYVEFDLTRWNLNWGAFLCDLLVGRVLDRWYGVSHMFDFTHYFFEKSTFVVRVAGYPPKSVIENTEPLADDDLVWHDHRGGVEGLQQKKWSLVTAAVIVLALSKFKVSVEIAVQGDNVVAALTWPKVRDAVPAEVLVPELIAEVGRCFSSVGQEMKEEECVESLSVLTYSKRIWINGVTYSTELKFASRIFPVNSSSELSLSSGLETIHSGAVMASSQSLLPLRFKILADILSSQHLIRMCESPTSAFIDTGVSRDLVQPLSRLRRLAIGLPSSFGGCPISNYTHYLLRGSADATSNDCAALRRLALDGLKSARPNHFWSRILGVYLKGNTEIWAQNPRKSRLVKDPGGLPLNLGGSLSEELSRQVRGVLLAKAHRNKDVHEAIALSNDSDALAEALATMTPFYPKIARDLYDSSIQGAGEKIVSLFEHGQTIRNLSGRPSSVDEEDDLDDDLVHITLRAVADQDDRMRFRFLLKVLNYMETHDTGLTTIPSAYSLCTTFRSKWGVDIRGMSVLSAMDLEISTSTLQGSVGALCVSAPHEAYTTRGSIEPYLGNKTRQKRADQGYRIISSNPVSNAVGFLTLTASQLGAAGMLYDQIDIIQVSRCGFRLSYSSTYYPKSSGGIAEHRAQDLQKMSFYLNTASDVASHTIISSNHARQLDLDYPIVVQEIYLTCVGVLTSLAPLAAPDDTLSIFLQLDTSDMTPIEFVSPQLTAVCQQRQPRRENALLFASDIVIYAPIVDYPVQWARIAVETPSHAVRGIFFDVLLRSHVGRTSIDAYKMIEAPLTFDVEEVARYGPHSLLLRAAESIAVATVMYYYQTGRGTATARTRQTEVAYRLAETVAAPLYRVLMAPHPRIRTWRMKTGIVARLGQGGIRESSQKIVNILHSHALLLIRERNAVAIRMSRPLDAETGMHMWVRAALFWLVHCEAISRFKRYEIVKSLLNAESAGTLDRSTRLVSAARLEDPDNVKTGWFSTLDIYSSSPPCYPATKGSYAIKRALRETNTPLTQPDETHVIVRESPALLYRGELFEGEVIDLSTPIQGDTDIDHIIDLLERSAGVSTSILAVALSSMSRAIVAGRSWVVVGSGNGAFATALAFLGAKAVYCHDLTSTTPAIPQVGLAVIAPEAEYYDLSTSFERTVNSFTGRHDASGLIDDNVLKLSELATNVVIDIQTFPNRCGPDVVATYARLGFKRIYYRSIMSPVECSDTLASFTASFESVVVRYGQTRQRQMNSVTFEIITGDYTSMRWKRAASPITVRLPRRLSSYRDPTRFIDILLSDLSFTPNAGSLEEHIAAHKGLVYDAANSDRGGLHYQTEARIRRSLVSLGILDDCLISLREGGSISRIATVIATRPRAVTLDLGRLKQYVEFSETQMRHHNEVICRILALTKAKQDDADMI